MGMALTPLIASFILFSLIEFCDKTHIAVITLSMKNSPARGVRTGDVEGIRVYPYKRLYDIRIAFR